MSVNFSASKDFAKNRVQTWVFHGFFSTIGREAKAFERKIEYRLGPHAVVDAMARRKISFSGIFFR